MLVSINWLKRHIDLPESTTEIEKALTAVGLEVEGKKEPGKAFEKLIVGKVLTCERHPDSDHLHITTVDNGEEVIQVVCGAPNVAAGQTIVLAPLGAELPLPNGEKLKMKKTKIRGVESFGMICAEDEIGLSNDHAGIMVLEEGIKPGTLFTELGFYDTTLELNVTPNRPDALSHRGVARELAAKFGRPLKKLNFSIVEDSKAAASEIELSVEANSGCSRYVGRVLKDIEIKASPAWLTKLLHAIEIPAINNVVDVTNFILMDIGQPLHSFDMDQLSGKSIHVRRAHAQEKITTIDHKEHALVDSDLSICDGDRPVCVAGVMGGAESEIGETTKNVFLESAYFDPTIVRKQSKRLGLSSDSSYRFERGIDPFMQEDASVYACSLIQEVAGGKILKGTVEYTGAEHPTELKKVSVRPTRITKVLGISPSADVIRKHLTGIGLIEESPCCNAPHKDAEYLTFSIPGFRPDLEREIDLIEEVARLIGFDNIPYDTPTIKMQTNDLPVQEQINRKIRYALSAMGLHECLSLRFTSKKLTKNVFGELNENDPRTMPAALLNPLSEDLGVLPTSLLPNLLKYVAENEKNRPGAVRLFEVAKSQFPRKRTSDRDTGFDEVPLLAIALAGHWKTSALKEKSEPISFSDFKGVIISLFKRLGLNLEFTAPAAKEIFLHPAQQAEIRCGKHVLGRAGFLHPAVMEKMDISYETCVLEVNLDVVEQAMQKKVTFTPFSKQVPSSRDISIEVEGHMTHEAILNRIYDFKPKNLASVVLKSIYQGEKIAAGKKNMVYSLVYQAMDKTLTDEEVNKTHNKLREKLIANGDIALR